MEISSINAGDNSFPQEGISWNGGMEEESFDFNGENVDDGIKDASSRYYH